MADKHQNKAIRAAIAYAISKGWRLERTKGKGHAWGKLYCRRRDFDGCRFTVYGTPAIPEATPVTSDARWIAASTDCQTRKAS